MKKYIALVVSMIFVLGFAASAFAIHAEIPSETQAVVAKGNTQITLDGELRVRGEIRKNMDFNDETNAGNYAAYDQRVRLGVTASVTPNTMGRVLLESNNNTDANDLYNWGDSATFANGARGFYPQGNSKRGDLRILEAWMMTKGSGLLGIPAGLKIGHMPLALGNKLFFDHTKFGDDAIVFFMDPNKDLHIGFLTIKLSEGTTVTATNTNVLDPADPTTVVGVIPGTATALNTSSANDADAYVGLFTYKMGKDANISFDTTYVNDSNNLVSPMDIHMWNFGLRGDMNVSGLGIKADVELQTGTISDTGGSDIKFRGRAALLGFSYKLDPVKLSLDGAYGSGDGNGLGDNKWSGFVTSLGADQHYTYVYEYRTVNAAGRQYGGLENTMYVKLGGDFNIMKDLDGMLSAYWLRAVKKNALDKRDIGTEIDAKVTYKIDRNLNYWVEGGYLFAGSFWDTAAKNADNPYAVRHGIQLNF